MREMEKIPNQVDSRVSGIEWSRVSKAADRSRRHKPETCSYAIALQRWSCSDRRVVSVEWFFNRQTDMDLGESLKISD